MRKMKLAIISDIHYPMEVSRRTILYGDCGYSDNFYSNLHEDLSALSPDDIDAFIHCGDFYWDYVYFASSEWDFSEHIFKLQELRNTIHKDIPIIFIEGNHDVWFENYIFSDGKDMYLDIDSFDSFLSQHLKGEIVNAIIETLPGEEETIEIGQNMHLMRNSGIVIDDTYVYGFPYYDKRAMTWSVIKGKLIDDFNIGINKVIDKGELEPPIKTVLCHHVHPPALKFVQAFNQPSVDIKAFYWGHFHTVGQHFLDKHVPHGPYQCVMPEKNNLSFQIYKI